MNEALKVGALAERAGLTVRTLHHYDEIGLLSPSRRTPAGHRLYAEDDVIRLHQIASLKQLGLPLDEIRACLTRPEQTLERTLELQIERIQEMIARHQRLRDLLQRLRDRLRAAEDVSIDDLTRTIEATLSHEKYYTPEQLEQLRQRAEAVGQERIEEVQRAWAELFEAFGSAMRTGLDPASDEVRALARRSASLIQEFTGGDPGITKSLNEMYRSERPENVVGRHGMQTPPGLWEYMARARSALETEG